VDVHRDVVLLGLVDGQVVFETPRGVDTRIDCKPSYDTLTILAHAAANAVVAGILLRIRPEADFPQMLARNGAALAHWHGMVDPAALPPGFVVHGESNPPVSCSTYQSAVYAFTGKLSALEVSLETNTPFAGDVHVEPFHGVNITGASLMALAEMVLAIIARGGVTQFGIQHVDSVMQAHRSRRLQSHAAAHHRPRRPEEKSMLVVTTHVLEGRRITRYLGLVSGEAILGANIFRDLFANIRDIVGGRSAAYEQELRRAKELAVQEMAQQAAALGGNAVLGVDLDYETIGANGSMLMVSASGTAAVIED
jgi:uncharacterized protein YbjQ (UPF0145 family)